MHDPRTAIAMAIIASLLVAGILLYSVVRLRAAEKVRFRQSNYTLPRPWWSDK